MKAKTLQSVFYALFIVLFVLSCNKEEHTNEKKAGTFAFDVLYTTNSSTNHLRKSSLGEQEYYNNFGNFIISLTPSVFIGKFHDMAFIPGLSHSDSVGVGLIGGDWPIDDPKRYADFSNNSIVKMEGSYGGHVIDGYYSVDEINLKYFFFNLIYFYQELSLPLQYNTVTIHQFNNPFGNKSALSNKLCKR